MGPTDDGVRTEVVGLGPSKAGRTGRHLKVGRASCSLVAILISLAFIGAVTRPVPRNVSARFSMARDGGIGRTARTQAPAKGLGLSRRRRDRGRDP